MSGIINPSVGDYQLLYAANGADTTAAATTVSSYALASQLGSQDALLVIMAFGSVTQQTASPSLYNVTDGAVVNNCLDAPNTAAAGSRYAVTLIVRPVYSTFVSAFSWGRDSSPATNYNNPSISTGFTGNWTIGFRHGGVTAGGTFNWAWSVYRLRGA